MRAVVQRVLNSSITVNEQIISKINKGITVLLGIDSDDDKKIIKYMIEKIISLRIFEDEDNKMNLSLKDINGELLIVPNFTIYADARKGRRPSFSKGAKPKEANKIFEEVKLIAKENYPNVFFGIFQEDMKVNILNDGPVTILLDSDKLF